MNTLDEFIVTGDSHIRADVPTCRVQEQEEWIDTQMNCLQSLVEKANEKKIPILHTGDLFHTSQVQDWLKNKVLDVLSNAQHGVWMIPGNHDLPWHNTKFRQQCSYSIVARFLLGDAWDLLGEGVSVQAYDFGTEPEQEIAPYDIVMTHQLVFPDEKSRVVISGKAMGKIPDDFKEQFPNSKIILLGDYHRNFQVFNGKQTIINPGCMTRQAADFKNYQPVFYHVRKKDENIAVNLIEFPDTEPVVTDEYLRKNEQRDERLEAFIETIQNAGAVSLSYKDNVERLLMGVVKPETKRIIKEIIENI